MLCAKFCWNLTSSSGEEDFSNCKMYSSVFRNYLPLKKGQGPSFEQTWIPSTKGCFVASLIEIS